MELELNIRDRTAIVGVGATEYYRRGQSYPRTLYDLVGEAVIAAAVDAGISVKDLDGFAFYSNAGSGYADTMDTGFIMEMLGIPEVSFTGSLTGGGGGSAGCIGLAAAALLAGDTTYCVSLMALQQYRQRLGAFFKTVPPTVETSFLQPSGLVGPGHLMSLLTRRHMHTFGTRREAFAEIAISQRENARNRPTAILREPITHDDYFAARMISDPLCLLDFCLETDGCIAVITTTTDRAKDCRQAPVHVMGATHGGPVGWGRAFMGMQMSEDYFASSGHRTVAERLYQRAGVGPADIDVALIYDHFSPMVLMQLEDYGFCKRGEGGPFVESGAIRYDGGSIPVNTHGGQLSEAYIIGMTHIREAVEQLRGVAVNQVRDAEIALVTGGPANVPVSGLILRR